MAYEGYFQLVQAVLEHFQVRTKEAGRNLAILRVSADCHQSTRQKKRDSAVMAVLEKCIPAAYQLTNTQLPTK